MVKGPGLALSPRGPSRYYRLFGAVAGAPRTCGQVPVLLVFPLVFCLPPLTLMFFPVPFLLGFLLAFLLLRKRWQRDLFASRLLTLEGPPVHPGSSSSGCRCAWAPLHSRPLPHKRSGVVVSVNTLGAVAHAGCGAAGKRGRLCWCRRPRKPRV